MLEVPIQIIWGRAVHSVDSTVCLFVILVTFHFGQENMSLFLIISVPGLCFTFLSFEDTVICSANIIVTYTENCHELMP